MAQKAIEHVLFSGCPGYIQTHEELFKYYKVNQQNYSIT